MIDKFENRRCDEEKGGSVVAAKRQAWGVLASASPLPLFFFSFSLLAAGSRSTSHPLARKKATDARKTARNPYGGGLTTPTLRSPPLSTNTVVMFGYRLAGLLNLDNGRVNEAAQ